MNENHYTEDDMNRAAQGQQVQDELERQIRAFGDTMNDAFRTGFEGRGMEIGDRAWDMGRAAVHAASYGINEAGRAFQEGAQEYRRRQKEYERQAREQAQNARFGMNDAAHGNQNTQTGMPQWARQIFGLDKDTTPVGEIRESAKKRHDAGCALLAIGITFAVIFGVSGIGCLVGLQMFFGTWLYDAIGITSSLLFLAMAGFLWMTEAGASRMKTAKELNLYADAAEGFDYKKGIPMQMLADLTHQKPKKARKHLQKFIRKGWLKGWLDEKTDKLYLTAEDYRAAQEAPAKPQSAPKVEPKTEKTEKAEDVPHNLEIARSFAKVLSQEKQLMQDEQAVEELDQMQKTTQAICDWLEAHPESLPKVRRFAEYYIPTTLKLLHTYNDVQGQQGENAETIRRDIAGILHTLNQAYSNLYDNLLSDVALDVSSEIAALQGMMANDGLTGEGLQ